MFFYISFLRPPPVQVAPFGTISITPQISNDLRTEPYENVQEIYYSWKSCPSPAFPLNSRTEPAKLTTWRSSTAYKEIPVPLPRNVREGQSWQLILSTSNPQNRSKPHTAELIDLAVSDLGITPLGVTSTPILFLSKGSKGAPKQERIERTFLLPYLLPNKLDDTYNRVEDVKKTSLTLGEQLSFDLDKKIWDSGIGLSSWLCNFPSRASSQSSQPKMTIADKVLLSGDSINVVELGAGTGVVSITFAGLRSLLSRDSASPPTDQIFTTDLAIGVTESALPLLQDNIINNTDRLSTGGVPKAILLDWDNEDLPSQVTSLSKIDVVMMADVTYNNSSFPSLLRTILRLVKVGTNPPLILLGYKERYDGERQWFEMSKDAGIHFDMIGQCGGAGGAPVEIWLGVFEGGGMVSTVA